MPGGGCLAAVGRHVQALGLPGQEREGGVCGEEGAGGEHGCRMHMGGRGGYGSMPAQGWRSLPLGTGLGLTETRQ